MGRRSIPWANGVGTPDSMKIETENELFFARSPRMERRFKGNKRKGTVTVDEPLARLLNDVMAAECIGGERLEKHVGLSDKRLRDLRKTEAPWKVLREARQALWAMGYDLEMRVRKVQQPERDLVLTNKDVEMRNVMRVRGGHVGEWQLQNMWRYLGMDALPQK